MKTGWLLAYFALPTCLVAGPPLTLEQALALQQEVAEMVMPTTSPEVLPGGYLRIGFDRLATFPIKLPEYGAKLEMKEIRAIAEAQIPEVVRKLDGKKVLVTGYVLVAKMEKGLATEFMLQQTPLSCCYGVTPIVNQWIQVRMPKGAKTEPDVPLSFYGTLRVRVRVDATGFVSSIFELEGERAGSAK